MINKFVGIKLEDQLNIVKYIKYTKNIKIKSKKNSKKF